MPGRPVRIYECEVTGVRAQDRLLDARSRKGAVFERASYLLPWINADGNGIDLVPKTGDMCMILASDPEPRQKDSGRMVMVIGFKVPVNPYVAGQELGKRDPDLPQGSISFRVRSEDGNEAHLILNAGGSLLLGANKTCRTLYSPIDDSITTLFHKWKLSGPGGYVRWERERGSSEVRYEAEYRVDTSEDVGVMRARVNIGPGDNPLDITVEDGGEFPYLRVRVDSNGEAWVEGESVNIIGRASLRLDAPNMTIKKRAVLDQGDPI